MKDVTRLKVLTSKVFITKAIQRSLQLGTPFQFNPAAYHIRQCPVVIKNALRMVTLSPEEFVALDQHDRTVACYVCLDPAVELAHYPITLNDIYTQE